jgi:hypothetical protein
MTTAPLSSAAPLPFVIPVSAKAGGGASAVAVADLLESFARKRRIDDGVLGGRCRPFALLTVRLVSFVAVLWFH